MIFRRRWLPAVWPVVLLAGLASLPLVAQSAASGPIMSGFTSGAPVTNTSGAPAPAMSGALAEGTPAVPGQAALAQAAPQQAYTLPPDKLAKAIALSRIRNILDIAGSLWGIVFLWLLIVFRVWHVIEHWTHGISRRRWVQGMVFFSAYILITALAGAVVDAIGNYYERAYGISVQSWNGWLGDQGKGLAITLLFLVPLLLLFNWMVRHWRRYWLGAWVITLPILIFALFILPLVVPLFYQQEALEKNHAALVAKIETLVARTGIDIPTSRMYLIKASAKSTGINAFVAGIGPTKRFVMWDTATDQMPDDEMLFVFGHESGHYVLHHIPKELAGDAAGLLFVYWACAGFASWIVKRYGAGWGAVDLASRTGFVVLLFAVSIAFFVTEPVGNAFSRYFEHQADVYGQEAIHGIVADPQKTAVAAFNKLGESWLEDPDPNPLIELWLYDHPSVQHRAEFAAHYDPWANGGHGEFFKR